MANARISWLQVKPDAKASLVATEAQDVLTATASVVASTFARVSWLQVKPVAKARVSWLQVRANTFARVSWLQVRSSVLAASLTATEAPDVLTAAATSGAAVFARVSWLQVRGSRVVTLNVTEAPDVLTANAVPVDRQVAGAWTPALKSRWMVLDASSVLPPATAILDVAEAPDTLSSTAVLTPRTAQLTATEAPDSLVAAAIIRVRTAQLTATEAPDQLTASVVAQKSADSPFIGGPDEEPSEFERAMMERIKYREDKRVAMNNAVAMSVVALLCEVLE